ncbi:O-antigen ligase family protein [Streptomyces sp. NPDC002668]|uniref:O-antigen ligase family protein n=1 Tax=Streptomyces sp. NPDC002668 TaxID=3154422 RepID=UPI00332DF09E
MKEVSDGQSGGRAMRPLAATVIGWGCLVAAVPVATYMLLNHGTAVAAAGVVVCLALLAVPRPDLALLILLGIVPVAAVVDSGGVALPLVAAGVGLVLFRVTLRGFRLRVHLALIAVTAFAVTWSFLLPQVTLLMDRSWSEMASLLVGLGLLAASAVAPPDPRSVGRLVAGSGAGVAGYLLVGGEYVDDRLTGLGLNPNYLGAMLALALVAAVGLARLNRSWVWLLPALPCAAAILETRSRGAFLMVAAGLACVLLVGRPLRHKVVIALTILAVATALPGTLDAVEGNLTGHRTSTELSTNSDVRKQVALLAARVALDHPVRGIGYGVFPGYAQSPSALGIYINTHNDYLRLAAEAGLGTLALFVALLWLGLGRRCTADQAILRSLGVAYSVGLLFANTLSTLLVTAPFWVSLGCLLAHSSRSRPTSSFVTSPALGEAQCRTVRPRSVRAGVSPSAGTGNDGDS